YDPVTLTQHELDVLRDVIANEKPGDDGEQVRLRHRDDFVERLFYMRAYQLGAQIVGFNLPFDISRLALRHVDARRSMRGGFSFILIDDKKWPAVSVKHLSQRTSWIRFTGTRPKQAYDDDNVEKPASIDRGYFVDVRTLASALLAGSHSLKSLSKL